MRNGATPIAFLLTSRIGGGGGIAGGMGPLMPTVTPFVFGTPFGITDSDLKVAPIQLPLLFVPGFMSINQRLPAPLFLMPVPVIHKVSGTTKDSTGATLGGVTVALFYTATNVLVATTTSDATGYYQFLTASPSQNYYCVAYLTGVPDVTGATAHTLVGQ